MHLGRSSGDTIVTSNSLCAALNALWIPHEAFLGGHPMALASPTSWVSSATEGFTCPASYNSFSGLQRHTLASHTSMLWSYGRRHRDPLSLASFMPVNPSPRGQCCPVLLSAWPLLDHSAAVDPRGTLPGSRFPGAGSPLGILSLGSFLSNDFGFSHVGAFDGQGLALGSFLTAPMQNTLTVTSSFLLCALAVKLNLLVFCFFFFQEQLHF